MKNNFSLKKKPTILHVYHQCTMQLFMTVIINEVVLQPLASQEITLHAQCGWRTHSRIHMEIYASVITEYNNN